MMMPQQADYLKNWLTKASNDLKLAEHEISHPDPVTDGICFHCQQAVEKFLKAFLIYHAIEFERTHNLFALLEQCNQQDSAFGAIDLKDLNFFGVAVRYPDDFYIPSSAECAEYIEIARQVKCLVETKIIFDEPKPDSETQTEPEKH